MTKKLFTFLSVILIAGMLTAQNAHAAFTLEDEKKVGKEIYDKLEKGGALLHNEQIANYIDNIGNRILAHSNRLPLDYHFSVVKSSAINAFATPGGYIYVNLGLINVAEDESELASVMAHEIGHANARHVAEIIEKSSKVSWGTLAAVIAGALLGRGTDLSAALIGFSTAAATTMNLKYSRDHEEEADRLGMTYLVASGYDPQSSVNFMKIMRRYDFYSSNIPSYFLTHPGTDDRIRYIDALIQTNYNEKGKLSIIGNFKRIQVMSILFSTRSTENDLKLFNERVKKNPDNVDDLYGLAVTEDRLGKMEDALTHYQQALAITPDDPDILRDTGITAFKMGKAADALNYLTKAVYYNDSDPETLVYLGKTYEAQGDLGNAVATLKKLDGKKIEDDEFYYTMAMIYGKANYKLEFHYNFGLFFKKKKKVESALFHFRAALPYASPGSTKVYDIENEIKILQKAPAPLERRGRIR
ncbi:MAG: M48 family metalloprotease [Syntrophales bacterium]|nr:M48 family metalloprotease [Syntrophales bacterium]